MKKDVTTKLAACEASLKRWQTRLQRATTKVIELDRLRRRLQGKMGPVNLGDLIGEPLSDKDVGADQETVKPVIDDLTIPPMLKRTMADRTRDELAARIEAAPDDPATKINRKRLEEMDRKRRGRSQFDEHAMPLTGKAALAAIKSVKSVKRKTA